MVLIAPPPPLRLPDPRFVVFPAGAALIRIFDPTRFGTGPLTFRAFGPLRRFDHHEGVRRGHGRQAGPSPDRRIVYAAPTLSCCVVEVFGDTGLVDFHDWHVAVLTFVRPLRLLDLRGPAAMRAGSVTALSQAPDHRLGQAWSRHFYDDHAYQAADGLLYAGAHNGEDALALYERAENGLTCATSDVLRLDDPALRPALLDIARENHLLVAIPAP